MSCARVDDHWGHLSNYDPNFPPYTPGSYDWAIPYTKEELAKRHEAWEKFLISLGARRVETSRILFEHELIEVKPMDLPSGLLFYMDYKVSGSCS